MGENVSTSPKAGNMNVIVREGIGSLVNTY